MKWYYFGIPKGTHSIHAQHQRNKVFQLAFPPIKGSTCIFPVWLSFTDDTIRHVPHRITWRLVHLLTGKCIFPFRTLYIPESWSRSELPMLWGFPEMETASSFIRKDVFLFHPLFKMHKTARQNEGSLWNHRFKGRHHRASNTGITGLEMLSPDSRNNMGQGGWRLQDH